MPDLQIGQQVEPVHDRLHGLVGLLGRLGQVWPAAGGPRIRTVTYEAGSLGVVLAETEEGWLEQLVSAAPSRGLAVTVQDDKDKSKGLRLSIRPTGKEARHGQ